MESDVNDNSSINIEKEYPVGVFLSTRVSLWELVKIIETKLILLRQTFSEVCY